MYAGQSKGMTLKNFSSLLLSVALLAPIAVACGGSSEPDTESSTSDITGQKGKLSCAEVFGECVGLAPSACQGGTWADAKTVSCGGGLGVGCCVKPTPPPPPPPNCPTLSPPHPDFCKDGKIKPRKDASGCTVGYDCEKNPAPASCASVGGSCVGLAPGSCESNRWADATKFTCGGAIGTGCCLPECPALSPPHPDFCKDGTIVPRKDATGCNVGFDCVK